MNHGFLFPRRLGGVLAVALASVVLTPAHADASHHGHGLSMAPAGLVAAIAESQAKEAAKNPAYAIAANGCASLKAGAKGASLKGCFASGGERFASGKHTLDLRLAAWGRANHLQTVSLQRTAPKANRVAYLGKGVSEWWRVLPMGYEQGFTLDRAPKGHGEVVLQLQANRAPRLEHGTLAWGALHYGKLRVVDATGRTLPSHLNAHGKTIMLAFDARHAQYPVRVDPMVWLSQHTLTDPGGASRDNFGFSVALSGDGSTALVGAYGTNSSAGAAYIYTQSSGSWTLAATLPDPGGASNDNFGISVALDSTGTTALVGALSSPLGGAGAAYVYVKPGSGWAGTLSTPTATLTNAFAGSFGWSVALDSTGTTALVGAPYTNSSTGAAYVYVKPGSIWTGTLSTPTATLADPANTIDDFFGSAVALDSAGTTALVGASDTNGFVGAAYIYTAGSGWAGTLSTPTATLINAVAGRFGESVALDSTGTTALVGAPFTNSSAGAACVFTGSGGSWSQAAQLTASGSAFLGASVALSGDGSTALVGADGTNSGAGTASLYTEPASGWTGAVASPVTLSVNGSNAFGGSVALDSAGTAALVGATGTNSSAGAAYTFTTSSLSAVLNVPASLAASTQYDAQYIVTNNGSAASADVQVQMPVPSGATYVSASASPTGSCSYDSATQVANCDLGSIAGSGTMATADLLLKSGSTSGTITQTASLVNGSPNLAQSVSTTVAASSGSTSSTSSSSGGGGGAIGPWALFGLLGLAGAAMMGTRRRRMRHA